MSSTITKIEVSPDGKMIGLFVEQEGTKMGVFPILMNSFLESFPALEEINKRFGSASQERKIREEVNNGKPLEVISFTEPDKKTGTFSLIVKDVNGKNVGLPFSLDGAHKMIPALQSAIQKDKQKDAYMPVTSFEVLWDWPDKPEEYIAIRLVDDNFITFSFLMDIRTAGELAERLSFACQRHRR